MPGRAAARPAHPLAKLGVHLDGKAERARIPSHPLAMQNGNMSGRDKMRIFPFWLTVTVLGVALLALRSAVPVWATITGSPFSYGGVTWCQSYHAYNGCNNVQSPSQYTVSFDPAQDSLNGSAVWLAMNSAATRSGAVNTWGNQTWRLIHADKLTPIRRAKMNGDPPTGRIGLTRLNTHQKTGRLTCILPPDSPARALRTCAL